MEQSAAAREGQLVPADTQEDLDLTFIQGMSGKVTGFLADLRAFFAVARVLQSDALAALETAKRIAVTDGDSDQRALEHIKRWKEETRIVEEHWDITAKVSAFHRRLTARRAVSTEAYEDAIKIVDRVHRQYVQAEQERVRRENEAREREAREQALRDQQAEADRMEAEALQREAAAPELSARETHFVALVVAGKSAAQAAKVVGFKDPINYGESLLARPKITAAIEAGLQAAAIRRQADAVRQQPIAPKPIERVDANIGKVKGLRTIETHDVDYDEATVIQGVIDGEIPRDVLMVNAAKMKAHAKALRQNINAWPSCRYRHGTGMAG